MAWKFQVLSGAKKSEESQVGRNQCEYFRKKYQRMGRIFTWLFNSSDRIESKREIDFSSDSSDGYI